MKKLNKKDHEEFMKAAWDEAEKAKCHKSHFGAVIVKDGNILARGHNEPVGEPCQVCLRKEKNIGGGLNSELCFSVHAEQNALLQALKEKKDISNALMYIGHIKNGEKKKFSGKPFCTVCSRLIAASGLKGVVLWMGNDYAFLSANEFNEESFKTILEKYRLKLDQKLIKAGSNTVVGD